LEVRQRGRSEPRLVLVEFCTYPESRTPGQLMDDVMLVVQARKVLPEVLALVLCPKGKKEVPKGHEVRSELGWTRGAFEWKVQELWKLSAQGNDRGARRRHRAVDSTHGTRRAARTAVASVPGTHRQGGRRPARKLAGGDSGVHTAEVPTERAAGNLWRRPNHDRIATHSGDRRQGGTSPCAGVRRARHQGPLWRPSGERPRDDTERQ